MIILKVKKLKVTKNQEFTISLADSFEKTQEGSNCPPPVFLGLRIFPGDCD